MLDSAVGQADDAPSGGGAVCSPASGLDDPALPVLSVVCGVAERDWCRYGLLMLDVYIDDSGRGQGPAYVLSGYLAAPQVWMQFSREWRAELDVEPSVKYFKMKEAASGTGQFEGHKRELIAFRIGKLVSILERHQVKGVTVALDRDAFAEIIVPFVSQLKRSPDETDQQAADKIRMLANPYFHCFYQLILLLLNAQHKLGEIEPVDFFFDEQGKEGRDVRDYWHWFRDMHPEAAVRGMMANEPAFRDDKLFLPLQAADLSAWQVRNLLSILADSLDEHTELNPIMARLAEIPHLEYMMGYKQCQSFVDNWER
jgi:hypothetical protein